MDMRKLLAACLLLTLSTPVWADCDVEIVFENDGDWAVTIPMDRARIRARVGTWHRMWPNAGPVTLAPGQSMSRTHSMNACAFHGFHRFEFAIEREPNCSWQGETITRDVWSGGGGRAGRADPDAGLLVFQQPESGFIRNDRLDPSPGRPPYDRDNLTLRVRDLGRVCSAARGD
jgi:hypothetical protein